MSKKVITMLLLIAITIGCNDSKKFKVGQTKDDTYLKATVDGKDFYVEKPINDFISSKKIISLFAKNEDKNEKIRIVLTYNNGPSTTRSVKTMAVWYIQIIKLIGQL